MAKPQQAEAKRKSVAPQRASDDRLMEAERPPQPMSNPVAMDASMNPSMNPSMNAEPMAPREAANDIPSDDMVSVQSAGSPYADQIRQPQGQPVSTGGVQAGPAQQGVDGLQAVQGKATSETVDLLSQIREEQGLVRRKAMEDFMVGMKQELGIPPEKILQAFSQMSEAALDAPPEASMKEFLGNLELSSEQMPRAAELYKKMVFTTGEAALNEKLIGLETGVNYEVLTPKQQALRKLNSAIDDMNNMFAMRGPVQQPGVAAKNQLAAESMEAQIAQLAQQGQTQSKDEKRRGMGGALVAGGAMAGGAAALASSEGSTSASSMSLGAESMALQAPMGPEVALEAGQSDYLAQQLMSESAMAERSTVSSASSMPAAMPGLGLTAPESNSTSAKGASRDKVSSTSADGALAKGGEEAALQAAPGSLSPASSAPKAVGPAAMMMNGPQPTANDEQANIRELIQRAQVVLNKGGGEMKMELRPEGMGQVHLKVSVDNGQVNVQMLTENDAAKRVIEKGFNELKASLAAHQLHVDNMKVEVGAEIQKHMDQNQDQARHQARQFAGDFMGQFRDDRHAFRQGFMDRPGWNSYNKEQKRSPADPAPVARAQGAKGNGSAKRLDLVA
jgi:flagellar hook-length control protein FliK